MISARAGSPVTRSPAWSATGYLARIECESYRPLLLADGGVEVACTVEAVGIASVTLRPELLAVGGPAARVPTVAVFTGGGHSRRYRAVRTRLARDHNSNLNSPIQPRNWIRGGTEPGAATDHRGLRQISNDAGRA